MTVHSMCYYYYSGSLLLNVVSCFLLSFRQSTKHALTRPVSNKDTPSAATTTTAPLQLLLLASNLSVLWVVNSFMCDSILLQMTNNAVLVSGWALDHSVFSKSWVVDEIELNSVSSLVVVSGGDGYP